MTHSVDPVPSVPEPGTSLSQLVAETLERMERDGCAALERACADHPALAPALRERVRRLSSFGLLEPAALPERLGGLRVLRRLGGGGMGTVYLAEQPGLDRQVALKVMRPEQLLQADSRQRFLREVSTLASLQHPGIVPVHAGGEDQGLPWLAMELVRGATLEEALAEVQGRAPGRLCGGDLRAAVTAVVARREGAVPHRGDDSSVDGDALWAGTWVEACLRLARDLAEALHHAHSAGVLHRDVKPSNVMLTPGGRVLLLDFGLAARVDDPRLSHPGQPVGTPTNMAPEQVLGESTLDARTDVYGLGITLYELLTLHQPFAGATGADTRVRVLEGRPPTPRSLQPALSRDAETVVLTAIDRDRSRRYPTAYALARDLDLVLCRRPPHARRPGPLLRARRWVVRQPGAASALLLGLLLCVGGPSAYFVQQRAARRDVEAALIQARQAAERATANYARALQAVDVLLTEVAEQELLDVPTLLPVRSRLLESALSFHEQLLSDNANEPGQGLAAAAAAGRAGFVLHELGRDDQALAAFTRQAELAHRAASDDPERAALLTDEAAFGRARALAGLGRVDAASQTLTAPLARRRERAAHDPGDAGAGRALSDALGLQAHLLLAAGDGLSAAQAYLALVEVEQARALAATVASGPGDDSPNGAADDWPQAWLGALIAAGNAADVLLALHQDQQALGALRRGQALISASESAGVSLAASVRGSLGLTNLQLVEAELWQRAGAPDAAEQSLQAALQRVEAALVRWPDHAELLSLGATVANNLGQLLLRSDGRRRDAQLALGRAVETLRRLRAQSPQSPALAAKLGASLVNLASLVRDEQGAATARPSLLEAGALFREATSISPERVEWAEGRKLAAWHLALVCLELDDASGARAACDELAAARPDDAVTQALARELSARVQVLDARTP